MVVIDKENKTLTMLGNYSLGLLIVLIKQFDLEGFQDWTISSYEITDFDDTDYSLQFNTSSKGTTFVM